MCKFTRESNRESNRVIHLMIDYKIKRLENNKDD